MSNFFTDKVFIITGASSGLGLEITRLLIKRRCQTVLFARHLSHIDFSQEVAGEGGNKPLLVEGDVRKEIDVQKCIEKVVSAFGQIDGMILSAGRSMWKKFIDLSSPSEMRNIMDVNYWGVVNFYYYGLPHIKKTRGRVVTISSLQSIIGVPYHTGYAASKHALNGFVESLNLEESISVLNVVVSWIRGTSLRKNSLGFQESDDHRTKNNTFSISVEECAQKVVEAIPLSKKVIYLPRIISLFPLVKHLFPNWLAGKIKKAVDKEKPETNHKFN